MKLIFSFIFFFILLGNAFPDSSAVYEKWNVLDKKIALKQIPEEDAVLLIEKYALEASGYFFIKGGINTPVSEWTFPLKSFSRITYNKNGNDYNDKKYNYFDGNSSWNHPANDLCIADTNNDCLDDFTGMPVDVVSMSGGVVIATDTAWEPGSILRAGKYVRIYDASNNCLLYYSHLKSVNKKPGDIVRPGDKIGEVGRTGRSMILSDGQTHLHIALLKIKNGYPVPEPLISMLKSTEEKMKE